MHLFSEIALFFGQAFFSGLWQGSALVLGIAVVLRLQPRIGPAMRFTIWTFAFALAAALPILDLRLHTHQLASQNSPSALPVVHVAPVCALAVALLWFGISAVRILRLVYQAMRVRRISREASPIAAEADTVLLLHTLGRRARLCLSHDVDTPCVIGFFSPRLLIPAALKPQLSQEDLHQIVLHECIHLHRYDDWINLAQKIGLALFPLNPALLWVDRRLGLERELACDAAVVAHTSAPFDYARCLTRLAEHHLCSGRLALALSAWGRRSELLRRVQQLLRPSIAISPLQARTTFVLIGSALIAASVFILRAPGFISFSEPAPAATVASVGNSDVSVGKRIIPMVCRASTPAHTTLATYHPHALASKQHPLHPTTRTFAPRDIAVSQDVAPSQRSTAQFVHTSAEDEILQTPVLATAPDRELRPVYLIAVQLSSSYAAVPYGNGWLIVQL